MRGRRTLVGVFILLLILSVADSGMITGLSSEIVDIVVKTGGTKL